MPPGATFLAQFVNNTFGPLGAVGRYPLGGIGAAFGIEGVKPGAFDSNPFMSTLMNGIPGVMGSVPFVG